MSAPGKCHLTPVLEPAYDIVIVGSGYGGAVAAAELAGCTEDGRPLKVCVLERGREYLPGAFPSQLADLPTHLRGSFGGQPKGGEGLFDIRAGRDLGLLVANGLGGGSLINAGVMEVPRPEVFDRRWPVAFQKGTALDVWYVKAKALLGASHGGIDNHIGGHRDLGGERLAKTRVLDMLGRGAMREAAVTVAMRDGPNAEGVQLSACKLCGDCATGCNYGAKESLDTNLLVRAARYQADIWCGVTVLRLQRPAEHAEAWSLELAHTDPKLRLQDAGPRWLTARRVILAAGTLGSSEILMRTQRRAARTLFSMRLGQGFSGNGDLIAFGYGYGPQAQANAVADEEQPPGQRRVGPTITGVIDTRIAARPAVPAQQIVVEELAVPGSLRRAAEESITTASTLHDLACFDDVEHLEGHPAGDPFAVQRERIRHMSVFAAMGDDGAGGHLELTGDADTHTGDGHVAVVWPELPHHPLFDAQMQRIDALRAAAGFGGRTLPNPLWRFMPESMDFLVQDERGPAVSVHPLGGCAMADDVDGGVVDDCGRVFDPARHGQPRGWHEGLVVLDGSVLCSALGTNPALTIAAVALRAVEALRRDWGCEPPRHAAPAPPQSRPQLADVEQAITARYQLPRQGTQVAVCERLAGPVSLADAQGSRRDCWVELTLGYQPLALHHLFRPDENGRLGNARLELGDEGAAQLRIFPLNQWQRLKAEVLSVEERQRREECLARVYRVKGSLVVMKRDPSGFLQRTARGSRAWWCNRGLRDAGLGLSDWARKAMAGERSSGPSMAKRIWGMFKLASRAGECRRFDYELQVVEDLTPESVKSLLPLRDLVGSDVRGHKHITYERPSNPWRQLQELSLTQLGDRLEGQRLLTLDPRYLAASGRPLMRIEAQDCHVEALVDFASLAAYFARLLLTIHVWNLRKPDTPRHRPVQRLPGRLPGLPAPEIHWLDLGKAGDTPVRLRLACYRNVRRGVTANPVLLIHGYSASGTSYAHPALEPSLAARLAESGRDVWVVDLRSSAGLPTACLPWTFEQVALNDIPAAVDYIWKCSGQQALDVVAHCMGAVMLSQAILSAGKEGMELERLLRPRGSSTDSGPDRHAVARRALPQRLRRVVLSQNGPVMVMSQQNIFRGYVMSYLEQLFGPLRHDFRPEPGQGLGMELLDRFLGSLPYSDEELRQENPWLPCRTEYLASRHRMDAIYGRTFSLDALSPRVLDHIDDLFGPLSLDTVAQVIHFTRHQVITDRSGRNRFVSREGLRTHWRFRTLVLHGQDNGLADVATAHRAEALLRDAGCEVEKRILPGMGHQDSLIGQRAGETCAQILDFLDAREEAAERPADPPPMLRSRPGWGRC
nr:GMC oxidoreductase [Solimonas sp. SE-A11]